MLLVEHTSRFPPDPEGGNEENLTVRQEIPQSPLTVCSLLLGNTQTDPNETAMDDVYNLQARWLWLSLTLTAVSWFSVLIP